SLQDTKTPMINSAVSVGLNIILNFILAPLLGIGGLALATSMTTLVTAVLLFKGLQRKLGRLNLKKLVPSAVKISSAAMVASSVAWLVFNMTGSGAEDKQALIAALVLLVILYFGFIHILKVEGI